MIGRLVRRECLVALAVLHAIRCSLLADQPDPKRVPEPAEAAKSAPATGTLTGTNSLSRSRDLEKGDALARVYCQACHLFPEPRLLDKTTWEKEALPFMSKWLGISRMNLDVRPGRKYVEEAGLFPTQPILPMEDWETICRYYIESAPGKPLPQPDRPPIRMRLPGFEVISPDYRFQVPLTTMVKIDPDKGQFYLGDLGTRTLSLLDAEGRMKFSCPVDSPPVNLFFKGDQFYATLIGSVTPSDEPQGQIVAFTKTDAGFQRTAEMASHLTRPTDAIFADLNKDGKEDFVVCGFGNYLGRLSWFEHLADDTFREHVLFDRPGAIRAYVRDFNRDGLPDIIVMMAQAREGIYLFTNTGKGTFSVSPVVEFPPSFGSSGFELVDFDGDGFVDILATNGDNGDLHVAPLKNYHGVRLFLNDGKNRFREAWFFPLNGAYRAVARDFDNDGNMDVAAISFFPDYEHSPEESFVFLKNKGGLQFDAFSFPECTTGRWITMDVGDLNGDGKPDIVLGSFIRGPNSVPPAYSKSWEREGPSFLILKNIFPGNKPARNTRSP